MAACWSREFIGDCQSCFVKLRKAATPWSYSLQTWPVWIALVSNEREREREKERKREGGIYIYIYIYIKKNKLNRSCWHTFLVPSPTLSVKGKRKKYNTCQQQLCDHPLSQGTKADGLGWGIVVSSLSLILSHCFYLFASLYLFPCLCSMRAGYSALVPVSISLHLYLKLQNIIRL